MNKKQLHLVKTQSVTFNDELILKSGEKLAQFDISYETYGQLNSKKSNAILICHALTGDAHAAGRHNQSDKKPGWWDTMIGSGKAFDTDKYFVICSNVLGSCKGSSGPSTINPQTQKPYGLSFPVITIRDMVAAQKRLIDYLGIKKLLAVTGGSMGGMQALEWSISFPDAVSAIIPIATTTRHTAQQIAFNEVARQAIMADPDWKEGDYYGKSIPKRGLAVSRMIGHITYMSDESMQTKFGRKLIGNERLGYDFNTDFEVENYLKYRGDSFVGRFDANSWLYLSKALDYFNLAGKGTLKAALKNASAKFLIISFSSDWLYPTYQSKDMIRALKANDCDVTDIEIKSTYGHDAFLIEVKGQSQIIKHFLKRIYKD